MGNNDKKKFFGNSKPSEPKVEEVKEVKPKEPEKTESKEYKTIMIQEGTDKNGNPNWKPKKVLIE